MQACREPRSSKIPKACLKGFKTLARQLFIEWPNRLKLPFGMTWQVRDKSQPKLALSTKSVLDGASKANLGIRNERHLHDWSCRKRKVPGQESPHCCDSRWIYHFMRKMRRS